MAMGDSTTTNTNTNTDKNNENQIQNMRVYHPYQDFNIPYQMLYHLPTEPELLFPEEDHRRSWSGTLTFYTGTAYITGATFGAARGAVEGFRATEPGESLKIRLNRVLNSGGLRGRSLGNSLGILGLIFSMTESGMYLVTGRDGILNSAASGLATGALYRAAAGPRSAVVAGVFGGVAAAAAVAGKQVFKRYVPI